MCVKVFVFTFIFYTIFNNASPASEPPRCDVPPVRSHVLSPGPLGNTAIFPWLGLLKVYVRDLDVVTLAVTGVVLIKDHFAIANAADVAKIPEKIFSYNSEAMFVVREAVVQYYSLLGYLTHPEHPAATLALVGLRSRNRTFPVLPVCQPLLQFSASNELYVLGFTDENGPFEKFLYKMEFVDQQTCKKHYELAKLTEEQPVEQHVKCAAATNLQHNCVWDAGTALVSNVTGTWTLIGFGVGGPGCAAPARFLSTASYWPWIVQQTSLPAARENYLFKQGFKKNLRRFGGYGDYKESSGTRHDPLMHADPDMPPPPAEAQYVPLHEVRRHGAPVDNKTHEHLSHYYLSVLQEDLFQVDRDSATSLSIRRRGPDSLGSYGNCSDPNLKLIYKDYVNVTMKRSKGVSTSGIIQYKISLYDLWFSNYTCITVKAITREVKEAYLQYTLGMRDGGDIFRGTPDEIIKHTPLVDPTAPKDPNSKMGEYIIDMPENEPYVDCVELYLRVLFAKEARLEVRVFGYPRVVVRGEAEPTTYRTFFTNPKHSDPLN